MDRMQCAELVRNYFAQKKKVEIYEEFAGNKFTFNTYEFEVAIFGEDFHSPPRIESARVMLSDEEYMLLLQWQLLHPECGIAQYDDTLADIIPKIEVELEDIFFPDDVVGTYAINMVEVKRDVQAILQTLNQ